MRGIYKSRDGCLTCRMRKKKCDCCKPICQTCQRLHLDCKYGTQLNWKRGSQFTLNEADRALSEFWANEWAGYWRKGEPLPLLNFSLSEFAVSYQLCAKQDASFQIEKSSETEEEQSLEPLIPTMELILDRLGTISGNAPLTFTAQELETTEDFLFFHFKDYMSKRIAFGEFDGTTLSGFELALQECSTFEPLNEAILALSALDFAKSNLRHASGLEDKLCIETYYCLHVKYLNSSINALYEALDEYDATSIEFIEHLILTLSLLCSAQINSKGDKNWVKYLSEASIILSTRSEEQIRSSPCLMLGYRYFSLRYVLLITTLRTEKLDEFMKQTPFTIIQSFHQSNKVDPMLGCSPKLIFLIHRMIILEKSHLTDAEYMELWHQLVEDSVQECDSDRLELCSHSYQLSAKICFCMILQRSNMSLYHEGNFKALYELLIPQLFQSLELLSRETSGNYFYPVWSVFILCTCRKSLEDRDQARKDILNMLSPICTRSPLCSLVPLRKAVEAIWKVTDLVETDDDFDWRTVLEKYDFQLALT